MNLSTAQKLNSINELFYRRNAASFSATRQHAWKGWLRAATPAFADASDSDSLRVVDVACGNLRFEDFLEQTFPHTHVSVKAYDNCPLLLPEQRDVEFTRFDVVAHLLDGTANPLPWATDGSDGAADFACTFGFVHHIPTVDARVRLIDSLIDAVADQGYVAVSFWRFAEDEKLAARACKTTEAGCAQWDIDRLDDNDYLVGWNGTENGYRYCHSFTEDEIDDLIRRVKPNARVFDRFYADGRTGDLNAYVVWKVGS